MPQRSGGGWGAGGPCAAWREGGGRGVVGALLCVESIPYGPLPSRAHLGAGVATAVGILVPAGPPGPGTGYQGEEERPPRAQPRGWGLRQALDLLL